MFSFLRHGDDGSVLACVANFSAIPHEGYRIGLPARRALGRGAQHRRGGVRRQRRRQPRRRRGQRPRAGTASRPRRRCASRPWARSGCATAADRESTAAQIAWPCRSSTRRTRRRSTTRRASRPAGCPASCRASGTSRTPATLGRAAARRRTRPRRHLGPAPRGADRRDRVRRRPPCRVAPTSRLRECDYGDLNGAPVEVVHAERLATVDRAVTRAARATARSPPGSATLLDELRATATVGRVLLVGHAATRFALDHLLTGRPLETAVVAPFAWQQGWEYVLGEQLP